MLTFQVFFRCVSGVSEGAEQRPAQLGRGKEGVRGVTRVSAGSPMLLWRHRKSLWNSPTIIHLLRRTSTPSAPMTSDRNQKRKRAHADPSMKPEEKVEVPLPPKKRRKEQSVQEKRTRLRREGERLSQRAREKTTISFRTQRLISWHKTCRSFLLELFFVCLISFAAGRSLRSLHNFIKTILGWELFV